MRVRRTPGFEAAARVGGSERLWGGCRWVGPGPAVVHGHAGAGSGPGEACPVPLWWPVCVSRIFHVTNVRYYTYINYMTNPLSNRDQVSPYVV